MSTLWDVLGFGAVVVDDMLYVDHYPPPDSKVLVRAKRREGGGLTGTALVAAARLGAKTAYCGVLGDDDLSLFTLRELEREGVDCSSALRRSDARPIHSVVIVDQSTGQRCILYSLAGVIERRPEEMTNALIGNCRVLFVDDTVGRAGLHAIEVAHSLGIPVVGDVESDTALGVGSLMHQIDHLIVGIDLARRATEEREPSAMVRALSSDARACCVVTAGGRGCWYSVRGGEVKHFPAFEVRAVDTTGCGDVLHGAYAACISRGLSVRTAIEVATAAAGLSATQPGSRAGIPDWATVNRLLGERTHPLEEDQDATV